MPKAPRIYPDPPPYVPRDERLAAGPSKWREIACRSCGKWTAHRNDRWWHSHEGTLACLDPETLAPYPET
jgi:hypothetical protein